MSRLINPSKALLDLKPDAIPWPREGLWNVPETDFDFVEVAPDERASRLLKKSDAFADEA